MSITVCHYDGREVTVRTNDPTQAIDAAASYWRREVEGEREGPVEAFTEWLLDHQAPIGAEWLDLPLRDVIGYALAAYLGR